MIRSRGAAANRCSLEVSAGNPPVLRARVTMVRTKTGNATVMQYPEALRLATMGGAEALGTGAGIGSIEPRKRADLQILGYRGFGLTPTLDPVQNLVYHAHSRHRHPLRSLRAPQLFRICPSFPAPSVS